MKYDIKKKQYHLVTLSDVSPPLIIVNGSKIEDKVAISTKAAKSVKVWEKACNIIIDTTKVDHPRITNYVRSSKGMRSDGLLLLILELEKK